jgi:hypothetical protein
MGLLFDEDSVPSNADFERRPANWLGLCLALAIAGAVSLSVHVIMLQVLGIPFPEDHAPLWASALNLIGTTTALIALRMIARDRLGQFWRTVLLTGLVLFMLKEGLRGAVMNGVVTTGWSFSLAGALIPLLLGFGIALFCAVLTPSSNSVGRLLFAGAAAGVLTVGWQMAVGAGTAPLMAALAQFARPDVYHLPYPPIVLVPAYLTFIEPLIACALLAALVWDRLMGAFATRLAKFVVLVVFIKGVVLRTILFPAFMDPPFFQGMLSQSQFFFEFAALAVLTAVAWDRFGSKGGSAKVV